MLYSFKNTIVHYSKTFQKAYILCHLNGLGDYIINRLKDYMTKKYGIYD